MERALSIRAGGDTAFPRNLSDASEKGCNISSS